MRKKIDAQAAAEYIEVDAFWLNALITLAFLIVLFSIYRLVLLPNQPIIGAYFSMQRQRLADHYHPSNNEAVAYSQLKSACRSNNPAAIRETLITWSNHFLSDTEVTSMEDILQQKEAPELHAYVQSIQSMLFNGGESQQLDRQALLNTVNSLRSEGQRQHKAQQRHDKYALPPLYKA